MAQLVEEPLTDDPNVYREIGCLIPMQTKMTSLGRNASWTKMTSPRGAIRSGEQPDQKSEQSRVTNISTQKKQLTMFVERYVCYY
jgi:hypothetical protein